jgi:hypothetical protein
MLRPVFESELKIAVKIDEREIIPWFRGAIASVRILGEAVDASIGESEPDGIVIWVNRDSFLKIE